MPKTRVEHVLGKYALRAIESGSDDAVSTTVTMAALYMATAGFLAEANALLDSLWSYRWPHGADSWLADRGMAVLWHAAGERPSHAPFAPIPIDQIEREHRAYLTTDRWMPPLPNRSWQELHGVDLYRRSISLARVSSVDGQMPSRESELHALGGLEKYIAEFDEPAGSTFALASCLAAELAARNGLPDRATDLAVKWAVMYPDFWANYAFECMAANRDVAPLLLQGILSGTLGLTSESCRRYLDGLLAAVDSRMRRGRSLVFGRWTWERLLITLSKKAIKAGPRRFTLEERRTKWIGRGAAGEEAIAIAEARLGLNLPDDYREFIRTSNGFSALSATSPALSPIEEIARLRDAAPPELFAVYSEYPGDDVPDAMERCILISDRDVEEMVLLIPPELGDERWQTWFFASWIPGEERFPSFRHYMEHQLQELAADTPSPNVH